MNLLNKIEQNLKHGSVTISIQAPQSITLQAEALDITVALSNEAKEAHTIRGINAQIRVTENDSNYGMFINNTVQMGNTTDDNEMYNMQTITIAEADDTESFILQPNESKTVALTVTIKDNPVKSKPKHYKYELHAKAKVEGIDVDPKTHQELQIL